MGRARPKRPRSHETVGTVDKTTRLSGLTERDWRGCYDEGWAGVLAPEAMVHPAKFSLRLLRVLYAHGYAQGWWKRDSVIGDPFAGVGCGGIVAACQGLQWVGVELEEKFVELARLNF